MRFLLGTIIAILTASAVYAEIDQYLWKKVMALEDRVNTLEKRVCVASGGSLATCDYIPR